MSDESSPVDPESADNDIPPYPVLFPKETGFSPLDSDNIKEWHKDWRAWERQHRSSKN